MKTRNNQLRRCFGAGASSEPSMTAFHLILDYPGVLKSEKDGALKYFED
jgi:hypothetical protein